MKLYIPTIMNVQKINFFVLSWNVCSNRESWAKNIKSLWFKILDKVLVDGQAAAASKRTENFYSQRGGNL